MKFAFNGVTLYQASAERKSPQDRIRVPDKTFLDSPSIIARLTRLHALIHVREVRRPGEMPMLMAPLLR